jgi:hypothetical protein
MTRILTIIALLFATPMLAACVSAAYAPPTAQYKPQKIFYVNKKFDEAYKELVSVLASTFFAIDNFEKDSGLITLSFVAAGDISEYIDCGSYNYENTSLTPPIIFKGKYEDFLVQYRGAKLQGRMNVVMKPDGDKTILIINSRYVFDKFVFDGMSESRILVNEVPNYSESNYGAYTDTDDYDDDYEPESEETPAAQTRKQKLELDNNVRICRPTGFVEQTISDQIERL